ncbi:MULTISPECIES: hypothetical protein [unclassified Symbiopectobacterium]|uniref:hypothetical protein n=1 Tax=unclassified Symbiopectobacterium TaxID=2794573 RepID=UPI002225CAC1|nr:MULTISPECIES: hypothetical protein [unclassified Symbiopectobacterium]MCW2473047.1 hypothetical protein [Candidatus Symbiopectobacterium sp. NZEC151]MCW2481846.1 hypothetical protein [Candidatus Symbiopectobacterium sp. NZEC135]
MIKISFMYIIILFLIPFVVECIFKGQVEILLYLGGVGVVNAIFIILMLFVKPFQSFYLSLIDSATFDLVGGSEAIDSLMSLRLVGITGFSAYTTGFLQNILALSMICYIHLSSKKIHVFYYISLGLIIISAIAVARSAIVGTFIIAIISLFYFSFFRVFKIISIITFLSFLSVWGIINILPQELSSFFIHWVTELFSSGMETGSVKSNVSMFIYSPSDFNILGFSKWYGDYGGYFMSTDIGWYRVLFSIGYLGLFIWMFFLVSLIGFDTLIKKNKTCILGWCILAYVFIMMFKGAVLFDSYQSIFVVGVIFYIIKRTRVNNYKRC